MTSHELNQWQSYLMHYHFLNWFLSIHTTFHFHIAFYYHVRCRNVMSWRCQFISLKKTRQTLINSISYVNYFMSIFFIHESYVIIENALTTIISAVSTCQRSDWATQKLIWNKLDPVWIIIAAFENQRAPWLNS